MSELPNIDLSQSQPPKVDVLKIRKLLENNYEVSHNMAEGIAEAIDIALQDQNLSEIYATKTDLKLVETGTDKVISKIDSLVDIMNAKFEAMDDKFSAKFEAMDHKFSGKLEGIDHKFSGKFDGIHIKFESVDHKFEAIKYQMAAWQKTVIILVGTIVGGSMISIIGFMIKYMPLIAKIVDLAGK